MNPDINNEDWTREEDEKLFESHRTYGSKSKEISKLFPGRYLSSDSGLTTPSKIISILLSGNV